MADAETDDRWQTDGKFFRSGNDRVWMKAVTYGPFPDDRMKTAGSDFRRMAAAGFNAVRVFRMPDRRLLDEAWNHGLRVFAGLDWGYSMDFFRHPGLLSAARIRLVETLAETASHPALAGVYVGNEIGADMVRWMGPARIRRALEELIALGREVAPQLMFAYANYPSTEYLEPGNADFTAFNVYLEDSRAFREYLKRLHHIGGDRPLVISEFGLDSRRNGPLAQAEALVWATQIAHEEETAGLTLYAWSDSWWNNGAEVLDWDFGMTDRQGKDKPALAAVAAVTPTRKATSLTFSVIVCTRNGRERIGKCLEAIHGMDGAFQTIVVDDGSDDGTADFVSGHFPWVDLLRIDPCGLSAARNAGAQLATGEILCFTDDDCEPDREWLSRLARVFATQRFAAVGGPNLPPPARNWHEAVVNTAPGAPSHVMLDDEEAEHLPGCNLAVTKAAFMAIGGFDAQFRTAGDDVDFCWRLRAAGFRLGFAPGAFVWHWRRSAIRGYLRQQMGYGRAERLLIAKHPERFTPFGQAKWQGFVYGGGPVRVTEDSIIYHGAMGTAGYQSIQNRMLPVRGLDGRFDRWQARLMLKLVKMLAPCLRAWERNRWLLSALTGWRPVHERDETGHEFVFPGRNRDEILSCFLTTGWSAAGPTDAWDAQKEGSRVLVATEHDHQGGRQTLVRLWGDVSHLPWEQLPAKQA